MILLPTFYQGGKSCVFQIHALKVEKYANRQTRNSIDKKQCVRLDLDKHDYKHFNFFFYNYLYALSFL